jgi:hypothetical protein
MKSGLDGRKISGLNKAANRHVRRNLLGFDAKQIYQTGCILLAKTTDFTVHMFVAQHRHDDYQQHRNAAVTLALKTTTVLDFV